MSEPSSWQTTADITDNNGNTGTAQIQVCADIEVAAGIAAARAVNDEGYTVIDNRVSVIRTGTCQH